MDFDEKHDAMLLEILKETKSPPAFLDAVFGFLKRRTDFYVVQQTEDSKFGFPAGFKEDLVFSALKKFDSENIETEFVPPAVTEVEIGESSTTEEVTSPAEPKVIKTPTKISPTHEDFKPSEFYNGAQFDNYCWSQTNSEIELFVQLPDEIKKAKDIDVSLSSMNVLVSKKNHPDEVYLEGQFKEKCKANNVVWTILNGKLHITIDKVKEQFWDRLFTTHKPIDVKKIDTSSALDHFPEKDQSAIEKMVLQDQQKKAGTYEMLKKGWNVEGSPFAGQEFDPSKVEIVPNV